MSNFSRQPPEPSEWGFLWQCVSERDGNLYDFKADAENDSRADIQCSVDGETYLSLLSDWLRSGVAQIQIQIQMQM